MKTGQRTIIKPTVALVLGWTMMASLAASVNAQLVTQPVTVTEITDWNTTPEELVTVNDPYLDYYGGLLAGINTLEVTEGASSTVYNGFCIDPFHWSAIGPSSPYYIVGLTGAPKSPAELNAFTATEIEDLWAEYYSPTMSSPDAAGLQVAIWELVSSNAVANDGLPIDEAFSLPINGDDYGASNDLASLATYDGPAANLVALTGPGQDFVISAPDGGATFFMLALTVSALVVARPAIIKSVSQLQKAKAIPVNRCSSVQGQANCAVRFPAKV
jgi:hypothetical protein